MRNEIQSALTDEHALQARSSSKSDRRIVSYTLRKSRRSNKNLANKMAACIYDRICLCQRRRGRWQLAALQGLPGGLYRYAGITGYAHLA